MLENKHFFYNYDLDSLAFKYGRIGGPDGGPVQGRGGVETSGSSTTVTAVTDTVPPRPFAPCQAGDILVFPTPPDTLSLRKLATKTSDVEIEVDTAIDLDATGGWFYYPFHIGDTTATDVWHHVSMYRSLFVHFNVPSLAAAGGIDYSIEGATGGNLSGIVPVSLLTGTITAIGTVVLEVPALPLLLRVGLKGNAGFAGTDSITVWVTGDLRGGRR